MGGAKLTRMGYRAAAAGGAMLLFLALAIPVGADHSISDAELYGGGSSDADVSGDPIDDEVDFPLSPLPDLGFTFGPVAGAGQQASGESALIVSIPPTPLAILNIEVGGVTVGSAPGFDGQILGSDDVIETGLASEATVVFFDASVLQLGPGTRIQLSEVRRPGESRGEITVFQWVGSTWSVVTSFADSQTRYQVETPSAIGIVRGTEFLTKVSGDGESEFGVVEGEVEVKSKQKDDGHDESANVSSGSSATVTQDPGAEGPVVSDWQPSDQESGELDQARDQHDDATAALADGSTVAAGDDAKPGSYDDDDDEYLGNSGSGGSGNASTSGSGESSSNGNGNSGSSPNSAAQQTASDADSAAQQAASDADSAAQQAASDAAKLAAEQAEAE